MRSIRVARFAVLAIAVVAAFLVGLYAIGPSLSSRHVARVSIVQSGSPAFSKHVSPTQLKTAVLKMPEPARQVDKTAAPEESEGPEAETPPPVTPADQPVVSPPVITAPTAGQTPARYRVQVGVFANQAAADGLAARLADAGFVAGVRRTKTGEQVAFIVSAGVFDHRADADSLASALREKGFTPVVIPDR